MKLFYQHGDLTNDVAAYTRLKNEVARVRNTSIDDMRLFAIECGTLGRAQVGEIFVPGPTDNVPQNDPWGPPYRRVTAIFRDGDVNQNFYVCTTRGEVFDRLFGVTFTSADDS